MARPVRSAMEAARRPIRRACLNRQGRARDDARCRARHGRSRFTGLSRHRRVGRRISGGFAVLGFGDARQPAPAAMRGPCFDAGVNKGWFFDGAKFFSHRPADIGDGRRRRLRIGFGGDRRGVIRPKQCAERWRHFAFGRRRSLDLSGRDHWYDGIIRLESSRHRERGGRSRSGAGVLAIAGQAGAALPPSIASCCAIVQDTVISLAAATAASTDAGVGTTCTRWKPFSFNCFNISGSASAVHG